MCINTYVCTFPITLSSLHCIPLLSSFLLTFLPFNLLFFLCLYFYLYITYIHNNESYLFTNLVPVLLSIKVSLFIIDYFFHFLLLYILRILLLLHPLLITHTNTVYIYICTDVTHIKEILYFSLSTISN